MAKMQTRSMTKQLKQREIDRFNASRPSLLNLPSEVRLMILEYLLGTQFVHVVCGRELENKIMIRQSEEWSSNLLLTCKVIAEEVKLLSRSKNLYAEIPILSCLDCLGTDLILSLEIITITREHLMNGPLTVWERFKGLKEIYVTAKAHYTCHKIHRTGPLNCEQHEQLLIREHQYPGRDVCTFGNDYYFRRMLSSLKDTRIKLYYAVYHYPGRHVKMWCFPGAETLPFFVIVVNLRSWIMSYRIEERLNISKGMIKITPWTPYMSDAKYLRYRPPFDPTMPSYVNYQNSFDVDSDNVHGPH